MREIKFRAWDKKNKIMSEPFEIMNTAYEGFPRPITDDNGEFDTHADIEIIQFTGLKDKNGKEIYEGDVVKTGDEFGEVQYDSDQTAPLKSQGTKILHLLIR